MSVPEDGITAATFEENTLEVQLLVVPAANRRLVMREQDGCVATIKMRQKDRLEIGKTNETD